MAITFYEMDGYPQEEWDHQGFSAVRKLIVSWEYAAALRLALMGHPGQVYPYLPSMQARVNGVGLQPFGKSQQHTFYQDMTWYDWALLTVRYGTPRLEDKQPYPESVDPVKHRNPQAAISESLQPTAEALKLDHTLFYWSVGGDALKPDEAPVRVVQRMSYSLTRHNLLTVPMEAYTSIGKCNSDVVTPILMSSLSFAVNTLLFQPPRINLSADEFGKPQFDVTYGFAYKEEGWRKYWRPDSKAYEQIKLVSDDSVYNVPAEMAFSVFFP